MNVSIILLLAAVMLYRGDVTYRKIGTLVLFIIGWGIAFENIFQATTNFEFIAIGRAYPVEKFAAWNSFADILTGLFELIVLVVMLRVFSYTAKLRHFVLLFAIAPFGADLIYRIVPLAVSRFITGPILAGVVIWSVVMLMIGALIMFGAESFTAASERKMAEDSEREQNSSSDELDA